MLLQQLTVVVKQGRDCVFCQDLVADLRLHDGELLGNVLLSSKEQKVRAIKKSLADVPSGSFKVL